MIQPSPSSRLNSRSIRRGSRARSSSPVAHRAVRSRDTNAIRVPSGDHAGSEIPSGRSQTTTGSPGTPIGSTRSCAPPPSRPVTTASRVPSGDQAGEESPCSEPVSRRGGPLLSVGVSQIAVRYRLVPRSTRRTATATCAPSGDTAGAPRVTSRPMSEGCTGSTVGPGAGRGTPLSGPETGRCSVLHVARGCGAAGSALDWQSRGQGFESPQLHPSEQAAPPIGGAACFAFDLRFCPKS